MFFKNIVAALFIAATATPALAVMPTFDRDSFSDLAASPERPTLARETQDKSSKTLETRTPRRKQTVIKGEVEPGSRERESSVVPAPLKSNGTPAGDVLPAPRHEKGHVRKTTDLP